MSNYVTTCLANVSILLSTAMFVPRLQLYSCSVTRGAAKGVACETYRHNTLSDKPTQQYFVITYLHLKSVKMQCRKPGSLWLWGPPSPYPCLSIITVAIRKQDYVMHKRNRNGILQSHAAVNSMYAARPSVTMPLHDMLMDDSIDNICTLYIFRAYIYMCACPCLSRICTVYIIYGDSYSQM